MEVKVIDHLHIELFDNRSSRKPKDWFQIGTAVAGGEDEPGRLTVDPLNLNEEIPPSPKR